MRTFLIAAALILVSSVAPAWAEDNPACAKFENPLEYNACLARLGPRAGATLAVPEPAGPVRAVRAAPSAARRSLDARLRGPTTKQWPGADGIYGHAAIERRASTIGREYERRGLQAFLQAFPNLGCFAPSFSKDSFGGFVGFQVVTRLPNSR
jgi:hypothetical protein